MLQGFVNFQFLGRLINSDVGLRHRCRVPIRRPTALQDATTATSWATARAGSWAAPCRRSPPSGPGSILGVPGMDYGGLLLNRSVDWNEFSAVLRRVVHRPRRPADRVAARAAAVGPRRERGLRRAPHREPVSRHPRQADLHHRELRRPPGSQRLGGDARPNDRRPEPSTRVQRGRSSARRRGPTCRSRHNGDSPSWISRRPRRPVWSCGTTARRRRPRPTSRPTARPSDRTRTASAAATLCSSTRSPRSCRRGVIPNECGTSACQSQNP